MSKITKEQALHRLNTIQMTMKTQNDEAEYNAMLPNFEDLQQYITQPSNAQVEEALNTCIEISAQRVDTINAIREIVEDWSTTKCMPEDVGNFAFSTLVKIKEVLDK